MGEKKDLLVKKRETLSIHFASDYLEEEGEKSSFT